MDKEQIKLIEKLAPKGSKERDELWRMEAKRIASSKIPLFIPSKSDSMREVWEKGVPAGPEVGLHGQRMPIPVTFLPSENKDAIMTVISKLDAVPHAGCPECGHKIAFGWRVQPVARWDYDAFVECEQCATKMWLKFGKPTHREGDNYKKLVMPVDRKVNDDKS